MYTYVQVAMYVNKILPYLLCNLGRSHKDSCKVAILILILDNH